LTVRVSLIAEDIRFVEFLDDDVGIVPAVAAPSIEAWLMCDPRAFAGGLTTGIGVEFRSPGRWPVPGSESEAKSELGRLVHDGCGSALARSGFEFAEEIVGRADLLRSPSASLADFARSFTNALRRTVREPSPGTG
jgi:hypothetical protein